MSPHGPFDLRGEDHVAAGHDDVAFPVDDGDESVRAHHRDISGEQPATPHGGGALRGAVPVPTADLRAFDREFPGRSRRDNLPGIAIVDDLDLGPRKWDS